MEVSASQDQETAQQPSWLSIITKSKRFSSNVPPNANVNPIHRDPSSVVCPKKKKTHLNVIPVQLQVNGFANKRENCQYPQKTQGHSEVEEDEVSVVAMFTAQEVKARAKISIRNEERSPGSYVEHVHHRKFKIARDPLSEDDVELDHKVNAPQGPEEFSSSVLTICRSSSSGSSSPSPGLLSCGSASSSAEDDVSGSTSTSTLSAFSNASSPSPRPLGLGVQFLPTQSQLPLPMEFNHSSSVSSSNNFFVEEHSNVPTGVRNGNRGFVDFHSLRNNCSTKSLNLSPVSVKAKMLSNQISVIKSTESYRRKLQCDEKIEEPQDLSVKQPKRFAISSSNLSTSSRSSYSSTSFKSECVQDLTFRSCTATTTTATSTVGPLPITLNTNSSTSLNLNLQTLDPVKICNEYAQQKQGKEFICSDSSNTMSSLASTNNSTSNSPFKRLPYKSPNLSANINHSLDANTNNKDEYYNGGDLVIDVSPVKLCSSIPTFEKVPIIRKGEEDQSSPSSPEINDTNNLDAKPKDLKSPVKESIGDGEIEVKARRGRKRKDDEAPGTKFDCFLCSFTCLKDNVLRNHMVRMHTVKSGSRGNVKCTVCAYACPSLEELRAHQELSHSSVTKEEGTVIESKVAFHACHHCTKKFRSQSQLEAHLRLITQKQLWKDLKTRRMM